MTDEEAENLERGDLIVGAKFYNSEYYLIEEGKTYEFFKYVKIIDHLTNEMFSSLLVKGTAKNSELIIANWPLKYFNITSGKTIEDML